jgi:hypothetical protein
MFEKFPSVSKALEIPQPHTVGRGRKSIPGRQFILAGRSGDTSCGREAGRAEIRWGAASNLPENGNLFPHGLDTETIVCQRDNQQDGGTVGTASR